MEASVGVGESGRLACSAVAYFKVVDAVKSVLAIENVDAAINQIAQDDAAE